MDKLMKNTSIVLQSSFFKKKSALIGATPFSFPFEVSEIIVIQKLKLYAVENDEIMITICN